MKYEAHIKTGDYSYLGFELEGTAEEAVQAYKELEQAYAAQGLPPKEFAEIAEEYLRTGKIANGGDFEFSPAQNYVLKLIKKIHNENK